MNEQIKKLAEQAWDATAVSPEFGHPISFAEKFAELIVKECSKIVLNCGIIGSNNERDFIVASREIKQHFGIKE